MTASTTENPLKASAGKVRELRFGAPFPSGSNLHTGMKKFAEVMAEESGGRLMVQLFPDSQLGDISGLLKSLQAGTVDIALLGIGTAADLPGGAALNIGFLPYLFRSREWAAQICNSPLFHGMYDQLAQASNVRVFASYGERLPRAFHTVRGPIVRPADMRGMKIRIAPIDVFAVGTRALGAEPVPTDLNEMYDALADGRIDGQENGLELTLAYKLYEVAKYWSVTDLAPSLATWYTHERLWQTFDAADRDIFKRSAKAAGEVITRLSKEINRDGLAVMRAAGVTITNPDIPAFRDALKDLYLHYEGRVWPHGLVEKIRALQPTEFPPS
jgi:TRAP-type C4-dicarboxylate transport system substrate-binding protein